MLLLMSGINESISESVAAGPFWCIWLKPAAAQSLAALDTVDKQTARLVLVIMLEFSTSILTWSWSPDSSVSQRLHVRP